MKHQTFDDQLLIKLRDLLLEKRDDVWSESLCPTEELIVWAWHASNSVLEEHGLSELVERLVNADEPV